ncbi:MAG: hypothetical protein ED559_12505 [Phycisphaera sp.]|nr:MAG: hypothetical protein ED559_12505 [Phycisphaera sp.]
MSGVNRTKAIRKTRTAQVAGLALVVLVGGAVMYDPGLPEAPVQPTEFGGPAATDPTQGNPQNRFSNEPEINPGMIGGTLDRVNGTRVAEEPETGTPKPVGGEQTDTGGIASSDGWKYLGGVFEPNFSFALVEIDGKQRMLRKGTRLDAYDAEVIDVARDKIEIDRGGVIERISLANSSGQIVSVATQPEQGAAATIITPGRAGNRDYLSDREQQMSNMADAEKRRAEFDRRQKELEERRRGENR